MFNPITIARNFSDFIHSFNSLVAPGGNLGISRGSMPQIDGSYLTQFLDYLKQNGISNDRKTVPCRGLKLTQTEYNKSKVLKLMDHYKNDPKQKNIPIIVSRDGFVLDGSHRLIAQFNADPNSSIKVIMCDADISKLLPIARRAGGVRFRNVSDRTLSK